MGLFLVIAGAAMLIAGIILLLQGGHATDEEVVAEEPMQSVEVETATASASVEATEPADEDETSTVNVKDDAVAEYIDNYFTKVFEARRFKKKAE